MGGRQSRVETPNSRSEEDDSWMSRVEVKPSQMLVKRLEQQQRNQAASQDYGSDEAPLEPVAADERNEDEGTYLAARQEEYEGRASELRVAKNAEAAHLAKMVNSVPIPTRTAERRQYVPCSEESQAVLKCYRFQRKPGEEPKCSSFVDAMEACASNAARQS